MKLVEMKFRARRKSSTFKLATCFECGWSISSRQTKINYVAQRAREHCQETGHEVEVMSTRATNYTAIPKE